MTQGMGYNGLLQEPNVPNRVFGNLVDGVLAGVLLMGTVNGEQNAYHAEV